MQACEPPTFSLEHNALVNKRLLYFALLCFTLLYFALLYFTCVTATTTMCVHDNSMELTLVLE